MTVGQTHQLGKIVGPSDAKVHWNVANYNIATIDQTGKITALAPGSTAVWIEVSKFEVTETATFTLTVVNPPASGVTITNKNQNTITVDDVRTYSATVTPSNADNKAVKWISTKDYVASINPNTGKLTALSPGTTIIRAVSVGNPAKYDEFTLTVNRHPDPFHVTNIENIRIKTWISRDIIDETQYLVTTVVTKSFLSNIEYFTTFRNDGQGEIITFEINQDLITQLENLEIEYEQQDNKIGAPLAFHLGKQYPDIFVNEGKLECKSAEYYGIWAYNGNYIADFADKLALRVAIATIAYSGFRYGFTTVMNMQAVSMLQGQTKILNSTSYKNLVESQKAIADITDDMAVQLKKTDTTNFTGSRRSWRASEMRVSEDYTPQSGYKYNKSFKIINNKLTEVPHGTAGSQRPDFYNSNTNTIIEVKNYNITTATGRNNLAQNIAKQYNERKEMFKGVNVKFKVDIYGQNYTTAMQDDLLDRVKSLTGRNDLVDFIVN